MQHNIFVWKSCRPVFQICARELAFAHARARVCVCVCGVEFRMSRYAFETHPFCVLIIQSFPDFFLTLKHVTSFDGLSAMSGLYLVYPRRQLMTP
jgi:hypothetical protein